MQGLLQSRDIRAGLFLSLAGAIILALTWSYPSGNLSDIGPGTMVQLVSGLMLLLGVIMTLRGLRQTAATGEAPAKISPRAFIIPAAMAVFALLLPWLGLALTAAAATFAASFGSKELSLKERLLSAIILAVFVTLLFGYGLRLQVPIWPELR